MGAIYPNTDTFPFMGLIPLATAFVVTYLALRKQGHNHGHCSRCQYYQDTVKQFRRIMVAIFLYILVMTFWVLAYVEANSAGQAVLPFLLFILVFGWKKWLLSLTDRLPIVMAMLIAGLWVENLDDMFQTMVFPTAERPGPAFATIWLRKFVENAAYMIFLTDTWFRFRVWIKDFLKRCFTGRLSQAPARVRKGERKERRRRKKEERKKEEEEIRKNEEKVKGKKKQRKKN